MRSTISAGPPIMISCTPGGAPGWPMLTGASSAQAPFALNRSAMRRIRSGPPVEMSTYTSCGRMPSRMPLGPSATVSTICCVGSAVMMTSHRLASSAGEAARLAPRAKNGPTAASLRSNTTIGKPADWICSATGPPIFPNPMKPTVSMRAPGLGLALCTTERRYTMQKMPSRQLAAHSLRRGLQLFHDLGQVLALQSSERRRDRQARHGPTGGLADQRGHGRGMGLFERVAHVDGVTLAPQALEHALEIGQRRKRLAARQPGDALEAPRELLGWELGQQQAPAGGQVRWHDGPDP